MTPARRPPATRTTTVDRRFVLTAFVVLALALACRSPQPPPAAKGAETLSRTEFTDRIENFFEYEPLVPGKASKFLIHLTDLSDGAPVEKAEVALAVRPANASGAGTTTTAKVGRVAGIYVAEVTVPSPGDYAIEFRVRTPKLDERMALADFRTAR
jgi:hypothetical protein